MTSLKTLRKVLPEAEGHDDHRLSLSRIDFGG